MSHRLLQYGSLLRRTMLAVAFALLSSQLAEAAISVEDLLAAKEKWEKQLDRPIVIEGRVSTMRGKTLILQKCSKELRFVSERDLPSATGADVAEVTGRLLRDEVSGQIYFFVERVEVLDNDLLRVQKQRQDLPKNDADAWYALGDWARDRAKFYGKSDDPLIAESRRIYELAVSRERRLMEDRTPGRLRALAEKARRYGIDDAARMSIIHESYLTDWKNVRLRGGSSELLGLATTIAAALPGGGDPLVDTPDLKDLRSRYLEDPQKFYDETAADKSTRAELHRLLYQKVVEDALRKEEDPEGKNGRIVAGIIKDYLPERIDEAAAYITAERNWRLKNVHTFRRQEMIELREEFLKLGERNKANDVLDRWFRQKDNELRRQGVDGLLDLASEYEIRHDLLDEEEKEERKSIHAQVIALLMEAYRKNPGLGSTQRRLEEYGYRLRDGQWKTPAEMEQFRNSPRQRAMAEGRVVAGMTGVQVVKSLGKPDRVSRILTARTVVELWAYGAPDETPLVVRLVRTGNRSKSIVTHWKQLSTAPAVPETARPADDDDPVAETGGF